MSKPDNKPVWGTPEWSRLHPLYFTPTEMKQHPTELVESVRMDLAKLRGKLSDIKHGFGYREVIETAEQGLTLVISYLYDTNKTIANYKETPDGPSSAE